MTHTEWVLGISTTVFVVIAGTVSVDDVNRRHAENAAARGAAKTAADQPASAPVPPPGACVDGEGSWKNWTYPNVPMLSPKCETK